MEFAENGRISHRQLYRQMMLSLAAPFLLCLFGEGGIWGIGGVIGTVAALLLLSFYVIFLIRVAPYFEDAVRHPGGISGRIIGAFFLIYVIISGAFLLSLMAEIVPETLTVGIDGKWISLAAVIACSAGAGGGIQRRGRLAEVSGGILLGGIILMMLVCIGQGKCGYLSEILTENGDRGGDFLNGGYGFLCAFSALGLLPFILEDVEKKGEAGKTVLGGVLTLGGIVMGMQLILPAVFGMGRLKMEKYPVLPLLSGADLPGNVLARFDIIWMGFLLYSLLFALGSLLYYGEVIVDKTGLVRRKTVKNYDENQADYKSEKGKVSWRIAISVLMYFLALCEYDGVKIGDVFGEYLAYIFVPGVLILQMILFRMGRGKWKKRMTSVASVIALSMILIGCSAAVEPEKRMYPLALGVDIRDDKYVFSYGMPDLSQATGQEKSGEEKTGALEIIGSNFTEIEEIYDRSQSKFMDLGHLEVLALGESLLIDDRWKEVLEYLKEKPFVGEDMYVFLAENASDILGWKGEESASVGEYLTGMMENRMRAKEVRKVTLREVFHEMYEVGSPGRIPVVRLNGGSIEMEE